jgi:hypothetical protein
MYGGTRWRSWLSQKVTGSIPDGTNGIFHWLNPSGRTMAVESTQVSSRTKDQKYLLESKGGRCLRIILPPSCADFLETLGATTSWSPNGLTGLVMGQLYLFYLHVYISILY